jgi:4'-phosphopantetheinyl transferase
MRWLSPQTNPDLDKGQIHVWRTTLDQPPSRLAHHLPCLSEDERARAMRFHFEEHRRDFIFGRGFLRTILARYLGIDRSQVKLEYTSYGKPSIAGIGTSPPLFFNLTHSHQLALLAVTREAEIGIDVEYVRGVDDGIPERYFSPSEVAALRALPEHLQQEAFFNCWTRKEAYMKARGNGLSLALDEFDVSLVPGAPAAILDIRDGMEEPSAWNIEHLAPVDGYIGAVAIRAKNCSLKLWALDQP